MAQTAKSINISKFEAGDRPTDQDFSNLFDSVLFLNNVGDHDNGLNTNNTSLLGNLEVGGNLTIQGTGDFKINSKVSFGNTNETVASGLHVYNSNNEPVIYASGSLTNIMFSGISGDATSSIKLTDSQDYAQFGTHTGKAFISVAGSEYFNITGSNLGPHSFFSGSIGIGSVANTNATERLRIFDADKNVSAHLQTNKSNGIATIGFENDAQSYTFGVRSNDNLTVLNGSATPFKVKSNATTDNLVLDGGKVGIGVASPTYPLHIETSDDSVAFFKSTDDGPTYLRLDTSAADADTHTAVLFMENNNPMGAVGYNAVADTVALLYATGVNSTSGINIDSSGKVGIGTKSPATTLDVRGDISIGATPAITLYDNDDVTAGPDILFNGDGLLAASGSFNINIDSDGDTGPNKFSVRVDGDTNTASELFYVSSSGQVSASGGFVGDGSGLTNITSGQIALFGGDLTPNNLTTINAAGDGLDGEANLTFDGNQLGIGIASPNAGVDVHINHNATDDAVLLLESDSSGNDSTVALRQSGTWPSNATGVDLVYDGGVDKFLIKGYTAGAGFIGNSVSIKPETPTDTLVLDATGQIGIGTSGPTHLLSINTETNLGGTLGNETDLLSLQFETSNTTNLLFTGLRTQDGGSDWTTVGTRIQSKVDSTYQGYIQFNGQDENGNNTNNHGISFGGGNNTNSAEDSLEFMRIEEDGKVGIGTSSPTEKLSVSGSVTIIKGTTNVIKFQNDNDVATKADMLFNGSGLLAAPASLIMNLNTDGGDGTFDIRTGDPQLGGEGVDNTSLIASFGTGSVGSGLMLHGNVDNNKPSQIQFNLGTTGLNDSGSGDGARIKYSTVDSQGSFYDASNIDFLVFEKLDSNNDNSPDGGILFTNSAFGSGGDKTENVAMAIRGTGNVGIGTILPDCQLSVQTGTDNLISRFFSTHQEDTVKGIRLSAADAGGVSTYLDLVVDPVGNKIGLGIGDDSANLPIGDANLDNAELVIASNGRVGIGTSNPGAPLEVINSSANEVLRVKALGAASDPYISFYNENTHRTRRAYIQAVSNASTGTGNELRLVSDTGGITFYTSPVDGTYSTPTLSFFMTNTGDFRMGHDKKIQLGGTIGGANDNGFIRFNYVSDSDSSLEIGTNDNSNEPIIFTQTGNERARIDTLGIKVLERITSADSQHTLITNSGGGYIEAKSNNSSYGLIVRDYNSSNYLNVDANSGYGTIGYNSSDGPLYLHDNDKVGIGINDPETKLSVLTNFSVVNSDFDTGADVGSRLVMGLGATSGDTYSWMQAQDVGATSNNNLTLQRYGGYVGIGTTTPSEFLEVKDSLDGDDVAILINNTSDDNSATTRPSAALKLSAASNNFHLRCHGAPTDVAAHHALEIGSTAGSAYISFTLDSSEEQARFANTGNLIIGTGSLGEASPLESTSNGAAPLILLKSQYEGNSTSALHFGQHGGGIRFVDNNTDNYFDQAYINDHMMFSYKDGGNALADNVFAIIDNGYNETFTGQHLNLPSTGDVSDYNDKIGYIVVSTGIYNNVNSNHVEVTIPTINEALPKVKLSDGPNDKKVFGVISNADDPNEGTRNEMRGNTISFVTKLDDRLVINSIGEGAVMVSNINGNLENGDYITTSAIEGLGMKQDDDLLHNYTVAKITQDCDFSSDTTDVTHDGQTYKMKLVGCTYHCG